MKQSTNKQILLLGEGKNQHTLYGKFAIEPKHSDFAEVEVLDDSVLRHEQPNGAFSNEHQPLKVEQGGWVMGKQIEFHPFKKEITQIWD